MHWYVSRNGETAGPIEDAQLAEWARNGLLTGTTFVRDAAGEQWIPLEHSHFGQRAAPRAQRVFPKLSALDWVVVTGLVGGVAFAAWVSIWGKKSPTAPAVVSVARAPAPKPPPPPVQPVVLGPKDGWATVRRPGRELPNTPAERLKYMSNVLEAHAGEPALKKAAARPLAERLRKELAKASGVSPARIKVNVGNSAAAVFVDEGVLARVGTSEENATAVGVCSEIYLTNALLAVPDNKEAFARAGVRAVMCTSTNCSALFDMRPTATGGGFFHGETCVSLAELVDMATQR